MYDYLSPLSQSQDFYAANDTLTQLVRPNLIKAQREIQALASKRVLQKEALASAETSRAAAFPTKAETYGQKLFNFGKAGILHGGEAKLKTELSVTDRLIKGHKEEFGVDLYNAFAGAEDRDGWLPTDRQIRNVYDTCRQDLTSLEAQRTAKGDEIVELGGKRISSELPSIVVQEPSPAAAATPNAIPNYQNSTTTIDNATTPTPSAMASHTNNAPFATTTYDSGYGATTATSQQSPAVMQVAGSGMFSHPVVATSSASSSGGYSNPADPFAPNNINNNKVPSSSATTTTAAAVDPFSTFYSNNNTSNQPPSSSQQQQTQQSADLLFF